MSKFSKQKVAFQVPKLLLARVDSVADELGISRSELIRQAIQEKVERHEREQLETALHEGYKAMSELRTIPLQ